MCDVQIGTKRVESKKPHDTSAEGNTNQGIYRMPFFMNLAQLHHCFKNSSGVVSDSRDLKPDCFFIALRVKNMMETSLRKSP